jgi:hypothetical protein
VHCGVCLQIPHKFPFQLQDLLGARLCGCFLVSFGFVLVRFRVSRCFLAQVVCALWRLLADSAQVPFSTTRPLGNQTFVCVCVCVCVCVVYVPWGGSLCSLLFLAGLGGSFSSFWQVSKSWPFSRRVYLQKCS